MPWSVQIISYEDDYKHRYDSGVYPQNLRLFKTKKKAHEYVTKEMEEAMLEHMNEYELNVQTAEKNGIVGYFNQPAEGDGWTLKDEYKGKYSILRSLVDKVLKGECVDTVMTFQVDQVKCE